MAGTAVAPPFRTAENKPHTQAPGFLLGTFTVLGPCRKHQVKQLAHYGELATRAGGLIPLKGSLLGLPFSSFSIPALCRKTIFIFFKAALIFQSI